MKKTIFTIVILLSIFIQYSHSEDINVAKFGLKPNTKENAIPFFNKALEEARKYNSAKIIFPKGRYDFIPTMGKNYSLNIYKAIVLNEIENLTIDGQGSEFVFHGRTNPFNVKDCKNICMQNFSIDWDRPMVTQGEFVAVNDEYVELKVDKKQYPYEIQDGKVFYIGEGWRMQECMYNQIFDKKTGKIVPQTHDNSAGNFYKGYASEIEPGIIRFQGHFDWERKPEVGNIVTMYHGIYIADVFWLMRDKDITIRNVNIYHGGSMGVIAFYTENITLNKVNIIAREGKGRLFSNMADGFHIKGCKGLIDIENCTYNGGGDDYVNVHSMYVLVNKLLDKKTVEVFCYKGFFFAPGDNVWFINHKTGQRVLMGKVKEAKITKGNDWEGVAKLNFEEDIPDFVSQDDAIESAEWTAEVKICNNKILKRHRATGIRVTTPKKVLIEKNYFNTAGSAILIEGDFQFWLESGAVNNVTIRNNVFDNCLTSGSTHGGKWEWGDAVIAITPSFRPSSTTDSAYHRNIIITNNKFKFFDYSILRARSVENLQFTNNKLIRTYTYKPYGWIKSNFLLEGCRNVNISNNKISKDFLGKNITTAYMNMSDIKLDPKQGLSITQDENAYIDEFINMKVSLKYKDEKK